MLQLQRQLTGVAERGAAGIIDPRAVERFPRGDQPRTDSCARLERFAELHRLEGVRRGITHRGDAPGEKDTTEGLAEVLLQMRMNRDETGNDRLVRCVDHRRGMFSAVAAHALDAIPLDDDVHVTLRRPRAAIPEPARMYDRPIAPPRGGREIARRRGRPRQAW